MNNWLLRYGLNRFRPWKSASFDRFAQFMKQYWRPHQHDKGFTCIFLPSHKSLTLKFYFMIFIIYTTFGMLWAWFCSPEFK